jgi:hypothetical protein
VTSQHQVIFREVPECPNHDQMHKVHPDQTQAGIQSCLLLCMPSSRLMSAYVTYDRTQTLCIRSHSLCSVRLLSRPSLSANSSKIDRTHPESDQFECSIRSLKTVTPQLETPPNFTTLEQMCQPLGVSPYACVLAYFHKDFQGC